MGSYYDYVAEYDSFQEQTRFLSEQLSNSKKDKGPREVAYITYAHLSDTKRFENHIFPSMDTWFGGDEPYFVVLGNQWKEAYHHGLCKNDSAYFKPYCERMVPIFVDCPEGYYGESPCCKNEKGMLYMLEEYGDRYGWFMYMDDDMYIRREYLTRYLEPLYPSDTMVLASGMYGGMLTKLGLPSFQFGNAKYNCSCDIEYMYPWGQPIIYSHGALVRAAVGFRLGGLVKQCLEYGVTHDVGNGIYHWMFQFPELRIPFPGYTHRSDHKHFGSHRVGHENNWNYSKTDAFFRKARGNNTFFYEWHNATGFQQTALYKDWGDPFTWTEWHTMNVSDCAGNDTSKYGDPFFVRPKPWTTRRRMLR